LNSLDNQREASEAYIRSQAHEGWKLIRDRYDDGGRAFYPCLPAHPGCSSISFL
jgi:hypothetical protein